MNMNALTGKLIDALIEVESGGDDGAIGDNHLVNRAYGPLQIRKPYVTDVNTRYGTSFKAEDCLGNRALSIAIFGLYMNIYAKSSRLGHPPTAEDIARIHNGGPNGYKNAATAPYWARVRGYLLFLA